MGPASRIARGLLSLALLAAGGSFAPTCAAAEAQDQWPQFRGPNNSGVSRSTQTPWKFGPTNGVAWKIAVPWSPSSPCVWGDRIFLTTFVDGQLETRAHDRATGRLLWAKQVRPEKLEAFHRSDGSPAASTPATDGRRVVSYFGSFGLICHDADGREVWRHPLPVALSGGSYGTGTSPVIFGDRVLINRDQDLGSSLLCIDLADGHTVWETPRPDMIGGFGTPVIWRNAGVDEVVLPGSVQLKGYDVKTGRERWLVSGVSSFVCTTPVIGDDQLYFAAWSPGKADSSVPMDWPSFRQRFDKNGDGKVTSTDFDSVTWDFIRGLDVNRDGEINDIDLALVRDRASRAENLLIAVRPGGTGDITKTHVAWKFGRGLPYVPSPLFHQGRIYLVKDGGMISCFDARSGKPFYSQERLGTAAAYYASPVASGDHVYFASLDGKLTVVKAGGDAPEIVHRADFGERIFATPALVGGHVYLRTEEHLYSLGD